MSNSRTYPLDGNWQLYFFAAGTYPFQTPDDLLDSDLKSIPAKVPGNVELDLVDAGLLPEPFVGSHIR